ncbi:hypothetical protein [Egicoccus sp. AB-alg6-2]|uniref:hypothetical protein n=1 Tax=Egicoccus sp. AB-alg6-2 TaxID=3242692 RepID=UPI00359DA1C5
MSQELGDAELTRPGAPPTTVRLALPTGRRVAFVAAGLVAALVVLGILAAVVRTAGWVFPGSEGLVALFHLDSEFNVPSIASVLGLTACGALLLLTGACLRARDLPDATRWRWLGLGFVLLAFDEGARIHERANTVVNELGISLAALRFGWVILGAVAVLALLPIYLPAVLRMPADLRLLAILSAALYVGGAVGVEIVGGLLYDRGTDDPLYQGAVLVEETGEMAGIALFFATLWSWWRRIAPRTELLHA